MGLTRAEPVAVERTRAAFRAYTYAQWQMKSGCGLMIAPWLVGDGLASHISGMKQIRAALKRLERMVFLPPDPRRRLRLVASHNEIRVCGNRRDTRKHLELVRTDRDGE